MALSVTHKCRFPNDLDFATKQLEAELANRVLANQELLKQVEDTTVGLDALMDEGTAILDSFFTKNDAPQTQRPQSEQANLISPDNAPTVDGQPSSSYDTSSSLRSTEDVADVYGLLPDNSTEEQDEKFITNAGIILFDTVGYLSGEQSGNPTYYSNIKNLRRLYFSLGTNLTKTWEILEKNTKPTIVLDKLDIRLIPRKSYNVAYTLDEIKKLLNLDYLTSNDVVVTHYFDSIVLLKTFLSVDKSKAEVLRTSSVAKEEIISNVFHFGSVDNSTAAISRYAFLGYTGAELGAILAGQDLAQSNLAAITSSLDSTRTYASKLVSYIDLVEAKFVTLSPTYIKSAFKQIKQDLGNLLVEHKKTISLSLFQVSVILQKDIRGSLALKHVDEKVEYLLRRRTDVNDLWFDAPDDEFLKNLRKVMDAAPVGSTSISNKAINNAVVGPISQKELLLMYADLYDALVVASAPSGGVPELALIRQYLTNILARNPETKAQPDPVILQGQPSAATPAGILTDRMDVPKTMNMDEKKKAVKDSFKELADMYPAGIAGPLSEIIDKITGLFEKAMKFINKLIAQAQKTIMKLKKRLDSFISKYLSLTGNASFSNSLLKCAINWDIGLSTDIIDRLFSFFFKIMAQILAFLSALKKWIYDLLQKILCLPVDLLNNFLGQVQVSLPSACKIPRFDLGKKLNTSMSNLKKVSTAQTFVLNSFGKDIAKLRIEVRAAGDKIGQFKSDSGCASSAGSNFMNASMLNVGVGVGV